MEPYKYMNILKKMIELIKLKILILRIQLQIKLLKEKRTVPNLKGIVRVIVHHGAGDLGFKEVNEMHRKKWGFKSSLGYYIGYQKFIDFNGIVYIGRRDNEEGAHTVGDTPEYYNKTSVGICLQGNKETSGITPEQMRTLYNELKAYKEKGLEIKMHCNFSRTLCPGKFTKDYLKQTFDVN